MITQSSPILCLCTSQQYLPTAWPTGIIVDRARLPKVAARNSRNTDFLNCGWKVNIPQATARTESCSLCQLCGSQSFLKEKSRKERIWLPQPNTLAAAFHHNRSHSKPTVQSRSTLAKPRPRNLAAAQSFPSRGYGARQCGIWLWVSFRKYLLGHKTYVAESVKQTATPTK
jgi:hypothetical protein